MQPITVSFGDNGLTVTLRGQEYFLGDEREPGMNITANYKFVKTPEGYKAVRQGDLQIYGFGQVPGAKRSFRQQGIYTVLQRKFGKVFAAGDQAARLQIQQRQVGRGRTIRAAGNHRPGRLAGDRLLPCEVRTWQGRCFRGGMP